MYLALQDTYNLAFLSLFFFNIKIEWRGLIGPLHWLEKVNAFLNIHL